MAVLGSAGNGLCMVRCIQAGDHYSVIYGLVIHL